MPVRCGWESGECSHRNMHTRSESAWFLAGNASGQRALIAGNSAFPADSPKSMSNFTDYKDYDSQGEIAGLQFLRWRVTGKPRFHETRRDNEAAYHNL